MALKHAKFDSFLKRTLDVKVYEQVKVSDPCVVISKNEKHTFRFAFMTDEAICITDNPPKSILFSIPFRNIRNARLVHDTPTFLQKDLQPIVQHILIKIAATDKHGSLHDRTSVNSASTSSKWKNVFNSIRPKSEPHGNITFMQNISPKPLPTKQMANQIENAQGFNSENGIFNSSFNGSFSEHSDDVLSLSGSLSNSSDQYSLSPRDQSKWQNSNPSKIEVLNFNENENSEEINLYILNDASIFYKMLKLVWKSYLLNSTASMDSTSSHVPAPMPSKQDLTNALLCELKDDLLLSFTNALSVERLYKFFHELKTVAKSNLSVKAYFWRDTSLFMLCGNFLAKYTSSGSSYHSERADEIECMVLVCETLSEMLRQTEALMTCHRMMQNFSNNSFYSSLINALTQKPGLPVSLKRNDELKSLVQEYTSAACDVLLELIRLGEQVSWICPEISHPIFTTSSLFSLIGTQVNLMEFLKSIMSDSVEMWSSARKNQSFLRSSTRSSLAANGSFPHGEPLTPQDVIKIYRNFVILYQCLVKCQNTKEQSKMCFIEEFKYYIRPESLEHKLPATYPASGITRNIMSAVACIVLDINQTLANPTSTDIH